MAQRTAGRTSATRTPAARDARKGSGRTGGPTTTPARSRPADRGGAGRPEPRPPARVRARRWFAGLDPWRRVLLALAALAVVAVVVALAVSLTRGTSSAPDEGFVVDPARVAELEAAEEARDADNLVASIEHAEHVQTELVPVLHGLHAVLPVDGSTAVPADPAEIAEWRATVDGLVAETESLQSGSSEHNIVRNGMLTSLQLVGDTLDAVGLAAAADANDPTTATDLYALAGELRTRAVDTWGLAAIQLDLRSTAGGQGHVHVFLPVHPDDSLDGGMDLGHEGGSADDEDAHEDHDH
ncbi:hypothetical protein CBR64_01470 [Cellulosimicrobium cellulans]|uniref:Uncharacterized protein n=1 Tax=Cellulosimicrobium cellulans TaxID=1710 RepID=A0A1Y0HQZ2_CELCE|nr:hypothetical protein [Cellulosimicrobium cellulans]ARU50370.1 hypothetical protein CBR64_01470 [Cellulosimicrobium cellulans]